MYDGGQNAEVPKTRDSATLATRKQRSPVSPEREAAIEERAKQLPKAAQANYLKAAYGMASPLDEIKAFCNVCTCGDRAAIRECTDLACPHYLRRPYQRKGE